MATAGGIACPRGLSPGCPGLVEILESREQWHSAEWGTGKDDRLRDVISGLIETESRGVMLLTRGVYRDGHRVVLPCCVQIDILHFGPRVSECTPSMRTFGDRTGIFVGRSTKERLERDRERRVEKYVGLFRKKRKRKIQRRGGEFREGEESRPFDGKSIQTSYRYLS